MVILLDLNYTLVKNQQQTRLLRPFSKRMEAEEYRKDLIEAVRNETVIIVTARPKYQMEATLNNIYKKTGWKPKEAYFNDINAEPPAFKKSVLERFILHRYDATSLYAIESNPKTRAMYANYGIPAEPYEKYIKKVANTEIKLF